jgi:DNA-directed RNA polymerase specialized sigma subunit
MEGALEIFSKIQHLDQNTILWCMRNYVEDLDFPTNVLIKTIKKRGMKLLPQTEQTLLQYAKQEQLTEKYELMLQLEQKDKVIEQKDKALAKKDEVLAKAVLAFYQIGLKPTEIAKKLDLPKVKVSQILKSQNFSN